LVVIFILEHTNNEVYVWMMARYKDTLATWFGEKIYRKESQDLGPEMKF